MPDEISRLNDELKDLLRVAHEIESRRSSEITRIHSASLAVAMVGSPTCASLQSQLTSLKQSAVTLNDSLTVDRGFASYYQSRATADQMAIDSNLTQQYVIVGKMNAIPGCIPN